MNADYSDQLGIFDPNRFAWPVHIIGLGGIGNVAALAVLKLGIQTDLHLWDDDATIEARNIPAQFLYRSTDIGRPKVAAMAEILLPYLSAESRLFTHQKRVTAKTKLSGVVISGVDSMASRQAIWQAVKFNADVPIYLDGRIGGEQFHLFTIDPNYFDEIEFYENSWLFPDAEAAPLPCAQRTVIGPPLALAGEIINQLTLFARGLPTATMVDHHVRSSSLVVNRVERKEE